MEAVMPLEPLYTDHAELYDRIYHDKDYAGEASRYIALLTREGVAPGARLVEAACGTGSYLAQFRRCYRVAGFDRSEAMLAIARRKLPDVPVWCADLESFTVDQPAAAIVCLFSSIGYVRPFAALKRCAHACFAAVQTGGVVLIQPFLTPDQFMDGAPHLATYEDEDLKIVRANLTAREQNLACIDFHWLVARRGAASVEHFVDHHELMMYERWELAEAFGEAGLAVRFEEAEKNVLVAIKPRA
jgi:daunosaminyl-N,N-dimethyltransferase/N-dimethyltransferase